jgi:hypothetical protein
LTVPNCSASWKARSASARSVSASSSPAAARTCVANGSSTQRRCRCSIPGRR